MQQIEQKYSHQCYLLLRPTDDAHEFLSIDPDDNSLQFSKLLAARFEYFQKIVKKVFDEYQDDELLIFISFGFNYGIDTLPQYGDNVVSIIVGDEYYRIPKYADKVKAIFKSMGYGPRCALQSFSKKPIFSYLNMMVALQCVKVLFLASYSWNKYAFSAIKAFLVKQKISPLYSIPLGYGNQKERDVIAIKDREIDVFFHGSLMNKKDPSVSIKRLIKSFFKSHKTVSRENMLNSIKTIKAKHPEWIIKVSSLETYSQSTQLPIGNEYSRSMMNSKICLVPRGTTLDTCRFFEALRYGCIIVTDCLLNTWFYNGAPVFKLDDWRDLEDILYTLLTDDALMKQTHLKTLEFWHQKCSPDAVGKFIVKELKTL